MAIISVWLLGLGLLLGIKHAFDADHVLAVSGILRKARSIWSSARLGISWGVGHMATAAIITVLLYYFRDSFFANILGYFQKIVGVMLIVIGIVALKELVYVHAHRHFHGRFSHAHPHLHQKGSTRQHLHKHIFGIGIIHGLASNDELLLLFTASLGITTIGGILLGVGFFSIGVIIGMVLFSMLFSYPQVKQHGERMYRGITFLTGSASVVYGTLILFSIV